VTFNFLIIVNKTESMSWDYFKSDYKLSLRDFHSSIRHFQLTV